MHTESRQVIHLGFGFFKYFEEVERDGPINGLGLGLGPWLGLGLDLRLGPGLGLELGSWLGIYRRVIRARARAGSGAEGRG